jgi:hypothetical protein
VYRVLAVVLTFFGGAGLLLYALGWLLLPDDRSNLSLTERALGRDRSGEGTSNRTNAIVLAAVLVLVAALAVAGVVGDWAATVLVLLVVGGIFLLLRRDGYAAPAGVGAGISPPTGATAGTATWYSPPSSPAPAGQAEPPGAGGPGEPPAPSYGDFAAPPPPPPSPRTPSVLGPVTVSVMMIALGVLAGVDASGADVAAAAYPALALLVIGLGLLVGTWYGRSRGLIALGVLAALALPPTIAADVVHPTDWQRDRVQVVDVTDVGAIRGTYDFRPGRAELDLTGATFANRTVRTRVDMPAGVLTVRVPQNVDVTATVDVGMGESRVLGRHNDGLGITDRVEDLGPDGRGGGTLELHIDQGVGSVEVNREAA